MAATVNSAALGGSLTVTNQAALTLGTPSVSTGDVLSVSNGGVLNVANNGNVTLELSGCAGASIAALGQINVSDTGSLTLQNTAGGVATFTNNGNIGVTGTASQASLYLSDGGAGSTFTLTGAGTLTLGGLAQIQGQSGDEFLVNDTLHTITGSGSISTVNLTNNGAISTSGGNLLLDASSTGTVTNSSTGVMNVSGGTSLTIQDVAGNASITNNGSININGTQSQPASLVLSDGGNGNTFTLTGSGAVFLNGNGSAITGGGAGGQGLINDTSHTIQGAGTISGLNLTNNGFIVASGGNLVLDAGGVSLTNNGSITVGAGSTLTIRDASGSGDTTVNNAGSIALNGSSASASLVFDSGGNAQTFTLGNFGIVSLNGTGNNSISGLSGSESLDNGFFHTIQGAGTVSGFTSFRNDGTLEATGGTLLVDSTANLTNFNAQKNTLYGGVYIADDGATLQLSSLGSSHIGTLVGSEVQIYGTGLLTGDGTTNAAAAISKIYSGSVGDADLIYGGVPAPVTLGTDANGLFTISSNDKNQNLSGDASLQLSGTTATVTGTNGTVGNLLDTASTYHTQGEAVSGIDLEDAGLTVNNLTNSATTNHSQAFAVAEIDVNNGSTLTVTGNVNNISTDNSAFGAIAQAVISVDGLGSNLTVSGTYNNTGAFLFGGPGSTLSLTGNSTATITGLLTNDSNSFVALDFGEDGPGGSQGSQLTTGGGIANSGLVLLAGTSVLNNTGVFSNTGGGVEIANGSTLTNTGAFSNLDGEVSVDGGSTLTVTGNFDNTTTSLGAI